MIFGIKRKIVIIGGSGFVGGELAGYFDKQGANLSTPRSAEYDATKSGDIKRLMKELSPDLVINCAGHTGKPNVDACETQREECTHGNVTLPATLRDICVEHGVTFAHISSGCIFSGRRPDGGGFRETDPPNFRGSVYSASKAEGEEALGYREVDGQWINPSPDCYLWRIRIPFLSRDYSRNYLSKVMKYEWLLDAENSLVRMRDFAKACWQILENDLPLGIYNIANGGAITTEEVTKLISEMKDPRFPSSFKFFESEETFMASGVTAPRSNCVLDTTKLESHGIMIPTIQDAIRDALLHWS